MVSTGFALVVTDHDLCEHLCFDVQNPKPRLRSDPGRDVDRLRSNNRQDPTRSDSPDLRIADPVWLATIGNELGLGPLDLDWHVANVTRPVAIAFDF